LFDIQDDITEKVASVIGDAFGIVFRADIAASKDKPPESLDAYECVLRLVAYYDAVSPDEHAKVRDCLERAVKTDPNYAPAWQALGMTYIDESRFSFNTRPDSLDRALNAIQRAIMLDPNFQYARLGKAEIYFARRELDAFFAEAARAIALNPSNATTLAAIGEKMVWAGEVERGIALVKKAAVLNPRHPDWYYYSLGYEHFVEGGYQEALEIWLKINMSGFFATHMWQAAAYGKLGRTGEAAQALDRLLEIWPTFPTDIWGVLDAYNVPEDHIEDLRDGLRKGGLEISDRPVPTN
jgi:adenylate cyclase